MMPLCEDPISPVFTHGSLGLCFELSVLYPMLTVLSLGIAIHRVRSLCHRPLVKPPKSVKFIFKSLVCLMMSVLAIVGLVLDDEEYEEDYGIDANVSAPYIVSSIARSISWMLVILIITLEYSRAASTCISLKVWWLLQLTISALHLDTVYNDLKLNTENESIYKSICIAEVVGSTVMALFIFSQRDIPVYENVVDLTNIEKSGSFSSAGDTSTPTSPPSKVMFFSTLSNYVAGVVSPEEKDRDADSDYHPMENSDLD